MKTINRRALVALVFGFFALGTGASFAQESAKVHACCAEQSCCRSLENCMGQPQRGAAPSNQMMQWYKAKYGRDYPGTQPAEHKKAASADCCKYCC